MITLVVEQITNDNFYCINSWLCNQQQAHTGEKRFNWQLGNRIQIQRLIDLGVARVVTVDQAIAQPKPDTFFLVTVPEVGGTFDTAWVYWLKPKTVRYLQQYQIPIMLSQPAEYDLQHSMLQDGKLVHNELLRHLHFTLCHNGLAYNTLVLHNISNCYRDLLLNGRKIYTVYSKSWVIVAQETGTKKESSGLITAQQHLGTVKDKDFVCFNRAPRELRCLFILSQLQHLHRGLVTFLGEHPANVQLNTNQLAEFFQAACKAIAASGEHSERYISRIPKVLPFLPMKIAEETAYKENHTVSNPHINQARTRAWFEIVIETHDIGRDNFDVGLLSEKVFWPILNQMPFILMGHRKNNQLLKDLGFMTFENDFGVDLCAEAEIYQRLDALSDSLSWFASLSEQQKTVWLNGLQHKIHHNYQLLINTNWAELERDHLRNIGPVG
jgi:hypothetical protein